MRSSAISGPNQRRIIGVVNRKHAYATPNVAPNRFPLRNSMIPPTSIPSAPVPNATGTKRLAWRLNSSALAIESTITENPNPNTASGTPLATASGGASAAAGAAGGVGSATADTVSSLLSAGQQLFEDVVDVGGVDRVGPPAREMAPDAGDDAQLGVRDVLDRPRLVLGREVEVLLGRDRDQLRLDRVQGLDRVAVEPGRLADVA